MQLFYKIFFFFVCFIGFTKGAQLFCEGGSRLSADGLYCECTEGLYNAVEGRCQEICEYYGDSLCGPYSGALCMQNPFNTTGFYCECPPGFANTSSGFCYDTFTCENGNLTCNSTMHEECLDLVGEDACVCEEGYYRTEEGDCEEIDPCTRKTSMTGNQHLCTQICTVDEDSTAECSCYEGFVLVYYSYYYSYECEIDTNNGFKNCICEVNSEYGDCAIYPNRTQVCYPKAGFQFQNGTDVIEDIDECEDGTYQCERGSTCKNDLGNYQCQCILGYGYDSETKECQPLDCTENGLVMYENQCVDPCLENYGLYCDSFSTCMLNEFNIPSCRCLIKCTYDGRPSNSSFSVYFVSFTLEYFEGYTLSSKDVYRLTTSMESIFGIGNAEVNSTYKSGSLAVRMNIGVAYNLEKKFKKLEDIILNACYKIHFGAFDYPSSSCVLPGGMFIRITTVDVQMKYPCDTHSSYCQSLNAFCRDSKTDNGIMPGRYECTCRNNYQLTDDGNTYYCSDINECVNGSNNCPEGTVCVNYDGGYACKKDDDGLHSMSDSVVEANYRVANEQIIVENLEEDLDDQQQKTKVVGAVLGALFAVVFVVLVLAALFIFKIKFM